MEKSTSISQAHQPLCQWHPAWNTNFWEITESLTISATFGTWRCCCQIWEKIKSSNLRISGPPRGRGTSSEANHPFLGVILIFGGVFHERFFWMTMWVQLVNTLFYIWGSWKMFPPTPRGKRGSPILLSHIFLVANPLPPKNPQTFPLFLGGANPKL